MHCLYKKLGYVYQPAVGPENPAIPQHVNKNLIRVLVRVKREVRRKMNFTYALGFVVLRDMVEVFPVSSSSFARKTTGRNRARSHSGP